MKILMLPAWMPTRMERHKEANYAKVTSFFTEQADDLHRHSGICVDVLMPRIYSLTKLPRLRSLPILRNEIHQRKGGETWIGYYLYFLPWSSPRNWRHFGEKLFTSYLQKHGMPDALWCCGVLWSAFLANHLHHKYKLPYFIVEHANGLVMDGGQKKSRRIKSEIIRLFQQARFNAAPCTQTARRMKTFLGDEAGEIGIVTNTISEYFENIEPAPQDTESDFVFYCTARIDGNKNHASLIAAFAEFTRTAPASKLHLAGDGADTTRIKAQIADLNLENKVILLGYLGRHELAAKLRLASAYITASKNETFNISLIEALACGLPCISTPVGVAEDAINNANGIVTVSTSANDILDGMLHVYKHRTTYDRKNIRNMALQNYTGAALAKQIKTQLGNIQK